MTRSARHALTAGARLWLVLACACGQDDGRQGARTPTEPDAAAGGHAPELPELLPGGSVPLTPTEHLTRASIALRGLRPSVDELEAVHGDPRYVEAIVDYYLTTPEFGETIRELHEEALLTGVDPVIYPAGFPAIGALADRGLQAINRSLIEAPLRLIEEVVMNDRPYSEIVTADYTLADDIVATVWGLPYDAAGERWQHTRYEDGRAMAGILSDSFLFTRHSTTFSNKSRGRANQISRALLCYDFLAREIPVDSGIDLADPEAVAEAVSHNPACVSCHETLDPLASYFSAYYPIYVPADLEEYPFHSYARTFRGILSVTEPGYFGVPGRTGDLRELGQHIGGDPSFASCAAQRFYSYLGQVPLDAVPSALLGELRGVFEGSGLDAKALAKAVVMSDAFRAAHATDDTTAAGLPGLKKMRPSALARSIEALTGYRWRTDLRVQIGMRGGQVGEVDLMTDSFFGFEVLAGGIDGNSVTRPSETMSATVTLALAGLAARAADAVVDADFAEPERGRRRLLRQIERGDTDEAAVRTQLVALQLALFGQFAGLSDPAVDDAAQLYLAALEASQRDSARAWKLTLYALLQDARMIYY